VGFFKRIRREVSRVGRRVEKQVKRTPAAKEAFRQAQRVGREAFRLGQTVEKGFIREIPKVARVAGIIAPFTGPLGLLVGGGVATTIQAFAARRARKKFEESQQLELERRQREAAQVPFPSLLAGLGSLASQPSTFQNIFTSVLGGIGKVAVPILQQAGTQFIQKQIGSIVGTPRAPTAAFVAQTAPFRGGGPLSPFPLPSPQVPQRRLEQIVPRNGSRPPPGFGFTTQREFVPAARPMGQKVQAVLMPDGSVVHFTVPKRRRMNVLNPRALSRAIRRVDGFAKSVMRSRKALKRIKSV